MTTPRRLLVDPVNACDYHLVSRCVQGAFLCGRDRRTGRDYSHRRQWLVDRIRLLACCFAVEVYAYCIMSNHFHLVARYDPLACWRWSDEEVARRWVDAFPPKDKGEVVEERKPEARELLRGRCVPTICPSSSTPSSTVPPTWLRNAVTSRARSNFGTSSRLNSSSDASPWRISRWSSSRVIRVTVGSPADYAPVAANRVGIVTDLL